jgi:hypothetical protein
MGKAERKAQKAILVEALKAGPIWAVGGAVYDCKGRYLFLTSDLADLRTEVPIQRTDAGGRPAWISKEVGNGDE